MRSIFSRRLISLLILAFSGFVMADQIENEAHELIPKGVLVKVDPATKTIEVFKAPVLSSSILNNTATADETRAAIKDIENSANKIADVTLVKKELDKDSSTDAWGYRWYGRYGGYGYRNWGWNNWGGYYRPYYYNWYRPYYYYPGYFNYGYTNYNYGWNYPYNGYYYGWYY